jgi:hypothetical protein
VGRSFYTLTTRLLTSSQVRVFQKVGLLLYGVHLFTRYAGLIPIGIGSYCQDAYRGHARTLLKDLEAVRPSAIIDIIHSGEAFEVKAEVKAKLKLQSEFVSHISLECVLIPFPAMCTRCGYMSSNTLCKACALLESLERPFLKNTTDTTLG